jgi:hypothetical protein
MTNTPPILDALGKLILRSREALDLTRPDLAARAIEPEDAIARVEAGQLLPSWPLVDVLCFELELAGQSAHAEYVRMQRSRAENPNCGPPGSTTLCSGLGDGDGHFPSGSWHWVRRQRGQVYCGEHGNCLVGSCIWCDADFGACSAETVCCPGCGQPIGAMAEDTEQSEVHAERKDDTVSLRHQINAEPEPTRVARTQPLTDRERVAIHNQRFEHTVHGLSGRAKEHYCAARRAHETAAGGYITRKMIIEAYGEFGSIIASANALPSDYRHQVGTNKQAMRNQWFLIKIAQGKYEFVGLDGNGDSDVSIKSLVDDNSNSRKLNGTPPDNPELEK